MKINAKIMLFLSMVLLLTFMTGSTAFDVDSLDPDKSLQEDCVFNETISDTALGADSNMEQQNDKPIMENNENRIIENDENTPMEYEKETTPYLNEKNKTDELKNFDGIVKADDAYSCGPASLATVLNRFGMNLALKDVSEFTDTTEENGTSMLSLINASKHFGFDAAGVGINASDLKENYIVHLNIDGNGHWTVIKNITGKHVFLMDPNEGNINFTLDEFNEFFSGNALVIFNDANKVIREELESNNITLLSDDESSIIFGKKMMQKVVGYKTVKKFGFVKHYGWKLMPVVSKGEVHFSQWKYVKGVYYTLGWYTAKEPIYKYYSVADDDALTSAPIKNVKKTSKTLKASGKTKKIQASKKTTKKTAKKTTKKTTKKNKK